MLFGQGSAEIGPDVGTDSLGVGMAIVVRPVLLLVAFPVKRAVCS